MFTELEDLTTRVCENCSETYQCHTSDKDKGVCKPCHGKARRAMFPPSNDLTPTPAPPCLSDLTQVEKSAISIICLSIAIHKKGTGSASKGHTITFFQDVETFASILPRVPDELPFIVLKDPSEKIEDRSFRVRKQKLLDALLYLKSHNEDYRHVVISRENADLYPEDDIIQSLLQLDPQEMKIPGEEPTAANEDSAREQASTVDIPGGQLSVVEKLRSVLQKGSSNDAPAATEECPWDATDPPQQVPWPKRSDAPVSEFTRGYFSMAFPDLFPGGRGDMTKPRLGKSPSKKEYFKHLLNVNRAFAKHHSFMFVATNILRRHEALTRGNVFAKRCANGLSMAELKQHMEEGNEKLLNKLMYFSAPIPGTKHHLRYEADKAISFVKFVNVTSDDSDMFTLFQTFSAADLHWDDFHRTLPESEKYLGKRLGLAVVILGDWKQLPPVFDSPLYHNPCGSKSRTKAGAAGYNVYRLFKDVIFFNQIERQAGEDQSLFRNELCRLSEGTFSEQDWQRWKKRDLHLLSREKQKLFLEKAVLACAYKKDMVRHNIEKVKANNQPIALIKAESKPKGEANKTSAERDSGLTSVIVLSKDTVFRLSCNLWTEAGLTNGAVGNVYDIVYAPNTKPPELPVAVIGIFNDYCGPSFLPDVPKSVPICPVQRSWISNKIHCSRTMLPIILGYALSIHKLQGSTLDKVILNAGLKEFALGLLFVGASLVKRFEYLTFEPFPNLERFPQIAKCTSLKERLQEEDKGDKDDADASDIMQ
ncbi:hypothetical protein ACOMHN_054745 [Nucella lapillus]